MQLITPELVILDKDGTLVKPRSGNEFVQNPEDQELLPGVPKAIAALVSNNCEVVVASNQGGVIAGYKTLENTILEMQYLMKLIPEIAYCMFCPDNGDTLYKIQANPPGWFEAKDWKPLSKGWGNNRSFRKPEPGMLFHAIFSMGGRVDLSDPIAVGHFLMVGDRPEDQGAAYAAGISFQWADDWRLGY